MAAFHYLKRGKKINEQPTKKVITRQQQQWWGVQALHTLVRNNPLICSEHALPSPPGPPTMDNQPDDLQENHLSCDHTCCCCFVAPPLCGRAQNPVQEGFFESPTQAAEIHFPL